MKALWVAVLFAVTAAPIPQRSEQVQGQRSSEEWFQRASEAMTLRLPSARSFHLRANFHATAGEEFLSRNEKSDIIAGDGTYDEVWFDTHTWRREVKLGNYSAVETDSNGVRRFQASGEYEPGRVMMLLDALYAPIPRVFLDEQTHSGAAWKIEKVTAGTLSLVRLSKSVGDQSTEYTDSYYFRPDSGVLTMSNSRGLATIWTNCVAFNGRVVPRSLTIRAGERELLAAVILIEPTQPSDLQQFEALGPVADPGRTLRPLHPDNIRIPDLTSSLGFMGSHPGPAPLLSITGVLDRNGRYREVEALVAPDRKIAATIISRLRGGREKPATIDGDACQFRLLWGML